MQAGVIIDPLGNRPDPVTDKQGCLGQPGAASVHIWKLQVYPAGQVTLAIKLQITIVGNAGTKRLETRSGQDETSSLTQIVFLPDFTLH